MTPSAPDERDRRPVILVTYRYFSTQHDAQGPTQSLRRMAEALKAHFRFRIVAMAMPGEAVGEWSEAFGIERMGIEPGRRGAARLRHIIRSDPPDLLLLSSFFDPQLTIAPLLMRRLRLIPRVPTSVAPRGEFSPGALAIKPTRKQLYLAAVRLIGLLKGVSVQATDPLEADAIGAKLPGVRHVLVAPNIRSVEPLPPHRPRPAGAPLRIAFLSRIDRKKNLHLALDLLDASTIDARFDIIGPLHDPAYWDECRQRIAALPERLAVRHSGTVLATDVVGKLAGYDLFLFPTAGENYGHVVVEALMAGTPALISDQTPWRELAARKAGVDLPLGDRQQWIDWIRRFAAMDEPELKQWRSGARRYIEGELNPDRDARTVGIALADAIQGA